MSLPGHSSRYKEIGANNIVIVPTVSLTNKHPITAPGTGNVSSVQVTKTTNIPTETITVHSCQIKPTPMDIEESKPDDGLKKIQQDSPSQKFPTDVNKNIINTEDLNKTKKASWASNYLQSIGHNNIKPIKINLNRSKLQKRETVSESNESNVAQPTLLNSTSHDEGFHVTENLVTTYPNKKIIGEHIDVGNNPKSGVNFTKAPVVPSIDTISTSGNSNSVLDTIYTKNNNNTIIAPPYTATAPLFAKSNGGIPYCYNNGKYEIDILEAIKSKINWESNERNTRTMNLPTHKDMCEEFIKEISNKPSTSTSERKRDHTKLTKKPIKDVKDHLKKSSSSKLDAIVKKLDKTDKKIIKESLKTIKKKTSDKDKLKKLKSSLDKATKKEKNVEKEKIQLKKQQNRKPIIDMKDFDILTEQIVSKDKEIKEKIDDLSSARQKLKRVRTISEELHKSDSEKCIHSPVKSIVVKTEKKCQGNSPKRQRLEIDESFDLRSKLSRVNQRIHRKQMENDLTTKSKPRENLKISVENQSTDKSKSPKKPSVLKYKTKKYRKLKLIINVVCQESDDETSSSDSNMGESTPTQNMDLSFLDDINVDEIVDSLKHSPKHKMKSPLSHERKLEGNTEMTSEPQLKLATILNMLQAKSETNKLKNSVKAEFNIEETVRSSSSNHVNPNPVSDHKIKEFKMNTVRKEENVIDSNANKNTTHALIKILSETKSQLDQQKISPPTDESLVTKCCSQMIDSKIGVICANQETQLSEDTDMLVIDESAIINERDMNIVDLTNETLLPTSSEVHNDSIEAISNFIQSEMQNIEKDSKNAEKDENENLPNLKPNINLEMISSNPSDENRNSNTATTNIDVEVETNTKTLDKNDDVIIDLTGESLNDDIHKAVERNNANTQKQVENEVKLKQEIHLIPLPTVEKQIIKNKSENDKITGCEVINENPKELVENIRLTNDRLGDANIKTDEPTANKSVIANNHNDTVKVRNEANVKITDKAKENVKNIPEINKVGNTPAKVIPIMKKVFETKIAKKIIKNIVDSVWDTKNELENTSKKNPTQNKIVETAKETKTEENLPKSNNVTVEKKTVPGKILSSQRKALAVLLEERMLDYLQKEIKVIKHIRLGKYSNIFSCKDSTTGEMYAAKVLINENNRHTQGIQKEQMIRQLQGEIPRENLNTVYLIDGFGIERHWCFLTEYYPKNLLQVFLEQKKPFHIDLVQDLTRQLMSAVMVLRNNEIVHSDIKPSHILMSSTCDRLKLCGFDDAYSGNEVYPLPNIGTSSYRAPEIILGFSAGYSIDVWSSALVIFQMATNQRLFTGVYNNDILYKQMCTFGSLPWDMVDASPFKNQHFQGHVFMRRVGYMGQNAVLFHRFYKTKRLQMLLIAAYDKHWMTKDTYQRNSDIFKMNALYRLLEQMLILDPRLRLAIEFVCADPFIYEMFS